MVGRGVEVEDVVLDGESVDTKKLINFNYDTFSIFLQVEYKR